MKKVYSNAINKSGLWSPKPVKMSKENGKFWDQSGNLCVEKLGLTIEEGYIHFASINKKEVEAWTNGILCIFKMLNSWIQTE